MANLYGPRIVTDGLVLCLDAGNNKSYPESGTIWNDLSGNNFHGTLTNGPLYNINNKGYFDFDGTNDYATANMGISNNADFTAIIWTYHKSDPLGNHRSIISSWDTNYNGFAIGTRGSGSSAGYIRSWIGDGGIGGMDWDLTSTIQNKWCHLALTYTFSTKTQRGYINSVFKNSTSGGTSITHSTLQIARSVISLYTYTNCLISNVIVYNRVLSPSEINQNYNATKGRYGL